MKHATGRFTEIFHTDNEHYPIKVCFSRRPNYYEFIDLAEAKEILEDALQLIEDELK